MFNQLNIKVKVEVINQIFLDELTKELNYLKNGGTSYRVETAELFLNIAKETNDIKAFLDRKNAEEIVTTILSEANIDRIKDVAKMLNVILESLQLETTLTDEVKLKLMERKRKRQPSRLVPLMPSAVE